jgi:hypothetical protein
MTRAPSPIPSARALAGLALAGLAALALACGGPGAAGPPRKPTAVEPATPAPAPAPATPAGELATAEAVIEASLVAQGGRARMSKLKAIRQTGTFSLPQLGMSGPISIVAAAPHNALTTIELQGLGKISQGLSGDVGWELTSVTGARRITGKELAQLVRDSTFNAPLIWKQLFPKAELAGVVAFEGRPAYKVVLTAADGDAQTRYFARDTLLPIGAEMVLHSQMGDLPGVAVDSDWREVDGIKYPHKLLRRQGPQSLEITIQKIEHDPPLDPSTFALPPEIAALPPPAP